jgi:hypothetical protein
MTRARLKHYDPRGALDFVPAQMAAVLGEDNTHNGCASPPFSHCLVVAEMPPGIEFRRAQDLHPQVGRGLEQEPFRMAAADCPLTLCAWSGVQLSRTNVPAVPADAIALWTSAGRRTKDLDVHESELQCCRRIRVDLARKGNLFKIRLNPLHGNASFLSSLRSGFGGKLCPVLDIPPPNPFTMNSFPFACKPPGLGSLVTAPLNHSSSGSAKAITVSPRTGLSPGLPPKP